MRFDDTKSETLNLRVSPTFKKALKEAADNEQRSMVNMLEVLLSEYCEKKGISLPAPVQSTPTSTSLHGMQKNQSTPNNPITLSAKD